MSPPPRARRGPSGAGPAYPGDFGVRSPGVFIGPQPAANRGGSEPLGALGVGVRQPEPVRYPAKPMLKLVLGTAAPTATPPGGGGTSATGAPTGRRRLAGRDRRAVRGEIASGGASSRRDRRASTPSGGGWASRRDRRAGVPPGRNRHGLVAVGSGQDRRARGPVAGRRQFCTPRGAARQTNSAKRVGEYFFLRPRDAGWVGTTRSLAKPSHTRQHD